METISESDLKAIFECNSVMAIPMYSPIPYNIMFSKETKYEILDKTFNLIKKGKSKEIILSKLPKKSYYIVWKDKGTKRTYKIYFKNL